jgi:hypothetical protein
MLSEQDVIYFYVIKFFNARLYLYIVGISYILNPGVQS